MRLTFPTITIAAATFAATLTFAPAFANVISSLDFDLAQFLAAPEQAPVVTAKQAPNCASPLGMLVDALGDRDCR